MNVFATLFLSASIALCISTSAASYTDDMENPSSNSIVQYANLAPYSFSRAASVVPDATAVTFSSGQTTAYAQYRVEGATNVIASVYSQYGTFVCQSPEAPFRYMLGVFLDNMDFVANMSLPQALFCVSSDAVYTYEGGFKQMYTNSDACYFGNVRTSPSGELIGYGVNIYYSMDGRQFIRAQAKLESWNRVTVGICYEKYAASVPESAKYIKVEINDVKSVPFESGSSVQKDDGRRTKLAAVTITGASLVMGEPEPKVEAALPAQPQTEIANYYAAESSSKAASKKAASSSEATKAPSSSKSKEASSKFEGTITSSSKSERASSSKAEKKSVPETPQSSSNSASSEQSVAIPDETIVYDIRRSPESTGFNSGVMAYIIIVCGVILALLIMQKRK